MLRPLRALLSVALLIGVIWGSFAIRLGGHTFAEHIDRIGQTPQAHELVDGARSTVNPVIEEATDRVLGEYIEAPTSADEAAVPAASASPYKPGSGQLPRATP